MRILRWRSLLLRPDVLLTVTRWWWWWWWWWCWWEWPSSDVSATSRWPVWSSVTCRHRHITRHHLHTTTSTITTTTTTSTTSLLLVLRAGPCDVTFVSVANHKAPFTQYNLLSKRLSNPFDNRLDVCLDDTAGCQNNRFDNRLYRVNGT